MSLAAVTDAPLTATGGSAERQGIKLSETSGIIDADHARRMVRFWKQVVPPTGKLDETLRSGIKPATTTGTGRARADGFDRIEREQTPQALNLLYNVTGPSMNRRKRQALLACE